MYVQNEGQFSTLKTVIAYYSVFILMVFFNTYINKNKKFWSAKNLLGIPIYLKPMTTFFSYLKTFTGIVLNSFSSILSYNHFNFDPDLKKLRGRYS